MKHGVADALGPLSDVLSRVKEPDVEAFERAILGARRIFVAGLGRTGLMARGFAMRLMHLGRRVYHVGDVITPAIRRGDLLVICSRTGRSPVLLHYVNIARRAGARTALVTAIAKSPVARKSNVVLLLPSEGRRAVRKGRKKRAADLEPPLGSVFEQALLLVLDVVVVHLMRTLGISQEDLRRIHTTFE